MKKILLYLIIFSAFSLNAQSVDYSYLTDKHFYDSSDLLGYLFRPAVLETVDGDSGELEPDEYSFGISGNYLYVKGEGITAAYNIGTIDPTKYGFKLSLMNSRDVLKSGHLKVILTGPGYVDALVFKGSKEDEELIFMLPEKSDEVFEADKTYYTDKWESLLVHPDSIWGQSIRPYFEVTMNGNKHNRLVPVDSLSISFEEKITITEKKKKIKKKKKKEFNIETGEEESDEEEIEETESVEDDEELVESDSEDNENDEEVEVETPEYKIKTKIEKEYFIIFKRNVQNEDGTTKIVEKKIKVKKWKEREDGAAKKGGDRFQISFDTNKGEIFLYLTDQRKISAFESNGMMYLMEGY